MRTKISKLGTGLLLSLTLCGPRATIQAIIKLGDKPDQVIDAMKNSDQVSLDSITQKSLTSQAHYFPVLESSRPPNLLEPPITTRTLPHQISEHDGLLLPSTKRMKMTAGAEVQPDQAGTELTLGSSELNTYRDGPRTYSREHSRSLPTSFRELMREAMQTDDRIKEDDPILRLGMKDSVVEPYDLPDVLLPSRSFGRTFSMNGQTIPAPRYDHLFTSGPFSTEAEETRLALSTGTGNQGSNMNLMSAPSGAARFRQAVQKINQQIAMQSKNQRILNGPNHANPSLWAHHPIPVSSGLSDTDILTSHTMSRPLRYDEHKMARISEGIKRFQQGRRQTKKYRKLSTILPAPPPPPTPVTFNKKSGLGSLYEPYNYRMERMSRVLKMIEAERPKRKFTQVEDLSSVTSKATKDHHVRKAVDLRSSARGKSQVMAHQADVDIRLGKDESIRSTRSTSSASRAQLTGPDAETSASPSKIVPEAETSASPSKIEPKSGTQNKDQVKLFGVFIS